VKKKKPKKPKPISSSELRMYADAFDNGRATTITIRDDKFLDISRVACRAMRRWADELDSDPGISELLGMDK
jgi:hypothetical protein